MINLSSRWARVFTALAVCVVASLLALAVASVVTNARDTARDTERLLRRGQQDRACLIALVRAALDPDRDPTVELPEPEACVTSKAAEESEG